MDKRHLNKSVECSIRLASWVRLCNSYLRRDMASLYQYFRPLGQIPAKRIVFYILVNGVRVCVKDVMLYYWSNVTKFLDLMLPDVCHLLDFTFNQGEMDGELTCVTEEHMEFPQSTTKTVKITARLVPKCWAIRVMHSTLKRASARPDRPAMALFDECCKTLILPRDTRWFGCLMLIIQEVGTSKIPTWGCLHPWNIHAIRGVSGASFHSDAGVCEREIDSFRTAITDEALVDCDYLACVCASSRKESVWFNTRDCFVRPYPYARSAVDTMLHEISQTNCFCLSTQLVELLLMACGLVDRTAYGLGPTDTTVC